MSVMPAMRSVGMASCTVLTASLSPTASLTRYGSHDCQQRFFFRPSTVLTSSRISVPLATCHFLRHPLQKKFSRKLRVSCSSSHTFSHGNEECGEQDLDEDEEMMKEDNAESSQEDGTLRNTASKFEQTISTDIHSNNFHRRSILSLAVSSAAMAVIFPALPSAATTESEAGVMTAFPALQRVPPIPFQSVSSLPPNSFLTLSILGDCGLGVSVYPDFVYNPKGGGGTATVAEGESGKLQVKFDPLTLNIPRVDGKTTSFLGAPLPPPIKIDIVPQALEGYIDRNTGQVELNFLAKFYFSAGPFYKPPPLLVTTVLTTEFSEGVSRSAQGERMDKDGKCVLVGTARVPPIKDTFLDNFLMLPTDVLAVLPSQFKIASSMGEGVNLISPSPSAVAWSNGQYDLFHKLIV